MCFMVLVYNDDDDFNTSYGIDDDSDNDDRLELG